MSNMYMGKIDMKFAYIDLTMVKGAFPICRYKKFI